LEFCQLGRSGAFVDSGWVAIWKSDVMGKQQRDAQFIQNEVHIYRARLHQYCEKLFFSISNRISSSASSIEYLARDPNNISSPVKDVDTKVQQVSLIQLPDTLDTLYILPLFSFTSSTTQLNPGYMKQQPLTPP
jgi:hypothetical protein